MEGGAMSTTASTRKKPLRKTGADFARLVTRFRPLPITSADQYDRTVEVMNKLAVRDRRSRDEEQYLDLLTLLVETYDRQHYDFGPDRRTAAQRLKAAMAAAGVTRTELAQVLGVGRSAVSMILSGKRQLSRQGVIRLSRRFKVDAGYFL